MSEIVVRTDRVGLLVEQLVDGVMLSRLRLDGLDDAELTWEPYPDMWSIRPREAARTPDAFGPGDHVLDADRRVDPFTRGPLTTMAWRIGHLTASFAGRWEWTFGSRSVAPTDVVDFRPDVTMLDRLWSEIDRWAEAVDGLGAAELDQVGYGQYPDGLDPHLPFVAIVRWMNREAIHHLAEVALLRDLYAAHHGS
jgi:hypothetical protein